MVKVNIYEKKNMNVLLCRYVDTTPVIAHY